MSAPSPPVRRTILLILAALAGLLALLAALLGSSALLLTLTGSTAFAAESMKPALPPGLEMLRRTERAFAKATSEIGVRNGFLMFFAEDAIAPPRLGHARERIVAWPAPVEPKPTTLAWEPLYGDIARSGDLGYLTGPSSYSDGEGKNHTGIYFSIWRKDDAALWHVILDAGLDTPKLAPEFASGKFRAAPATSWVSPAGEPDAGEGIESLKGADRDFFRAASASVAKAYDASLAEQARLHRDGRFPVVGRGAILADPAAAKTTMSGKGLEAGVSKAGDLGWTFGTCEWTQDGATHQGAYTHVWKRDDRGDWRIAVDVLNPAAKE